MRHALFMGAAVVGLGGCGERPRLHADGAWVRLAAVPGAPAAAYLTLHGGERDTVLAGVSTDAAGRAEMHQSMTSGTMTAMRPLARVVVPAGGVVRFAPGGRHVMLFDLDPRVRPGGTVSLRLRYGGGGAERVAARVVAAGDPPPA